MARKFILFGAGNIAKMLLKTMLSDVDVAYICDNDSNKWNTPLHIGSRTIMVYPPDKLLDEDQNSINVLIACAATVAVFYQLKNMKIDNCFTWNRSINKNNVLIFGNNAKKIEKVSELLADERSKYVFNRVISKRAADEIDFSELYEKGQYFIEKIFPVYKNEVFIDAGVLEGDTIEGFLRYTNYNYKKIYAFEPNLKCFELLKKNFDSDKIELFPNAVYDEPVQVCFDGNQISAEGKNIVETIRIDDVVDDEVTFIKMDVEGAELKALYGAQKIIKTYRPKLAICLYHKLEDLWEIPLLLNKWIPEYKLYIRHHSNTWFETVLYAVVE